MCYNSPRGLPRLRGFLFMKYVGPNSEQTLTAYDPIAEENFYVEGTEATGAINVNALITPSGTQDTNLVKVGGAAISLGQTTMSASLPVTIASNQSALPVSQSGTWNITNISGTISLPTGASTSALQSTGNTSLASIDSKTPALGQALAAASVPVVLTAAQISTLTPLSTVAATQSGTWNITNISGTVSLPTGASTSANQTSGNQLTQIVDAGGDAVTVTGGKLDVNATISGTGGGTAEVDNSAFTAGSGSATPIAGFYHSTIDTVTDGRVATVGLTSKRGLFVNLQTAAGVETGIAAAPLQVSLANTAANATAVKVDGSAVTQPISGTVTANIGTTNGLALDTSVNGLLLAQGSTTASQTGPLVQAAVTTAAPSYTTAQTAPLSQTVGGSLRTSVTNTVTVAGSKTNNSGGAGATNIGALPAIATTAQPSYTTTNQVALSTTTNGSLRGVIQDGAGNDRAANVSAGNALLVDASATTQPVSGTVTVTATNLSTNLAQVNGVTTLAGNGVSGTGAQRVTIASDSTGQTAPAANATSTGTAIYNNTALSSTKQAANASAGNLYGYHIYNPNSIVIYIQLFNVASAGVTVGSTAPTAVIAVPPLGWADATPATPIAFATALTIAATTTSTGSGAPTTALLCNLWYK